MAVYYNEIDLYAAEWLRNLIKAGHIADGEVDTRSIIDVQPDDIRHFDQCHFFAGIAGWSHALRLAGWADDRKIWTGSCPCQPFSVAGKGKGTDDERHLWPHFFRLIRGCRPPVVMGEQVAGAAGYGWLDGVRSDLESESYAIEGVDIPACSVNAPHIRQRLYWVAHPSDIRTRRELGETSDQKWSTVDTGTESLRQGYGSCSSNRIDSRDTINMDNTWCKRGQREAQTIQSSYGKKDRLSSSSGYTDGMGNAESLRRRGWTDNEDGWWRQLASPNSCARSDMADAKSYDSRCEAKSSNNISSQANRSANRNSGCSGSSAFWHDAIWLNGADGKTRRAEPNIRLLAHGVPARVGKLRAYGNAIVPPLAAEVIKAFMESQ
jgi:DNA (cytosine-5)-methyltransferase 1